MMVDMKMFPILTMLDVYSNTVQEDNNTNIQSDLYLEALNLTNEDMMKKATNLEYWFTSSNTLENTQNYFHRLMNS